MPATGLREAKLCRLALAFLSATILGAGSARAEDTIKIGGLVSVTGGAASIGKIAETAWNLAINEINASGGVLGKKLELVMADTMTDPTHALNEARRLVDSEKVVAILGPATSQETAPTLAVTTAGKVTQITTAASSQITVQMAPYHFTTSPRGANQLIPSIDYALQTLKVSKIGLISDNGGAAKSAIADIVPYMKDKGVEPSGIQEFAFRTEDMTPQLLGLRSSGAEVVVLINSTGDDARKFLENRMDIGWDVPVIASPAMTTTAVGNAAVIGHEPFEGVYSLQFVGLTYCNGDPLGQSLFAQYTKRAKAAIPDLERIGGPASLQLYYIQPYLLAAAINGSGKTDGPSLTAWLENNVQTVDTIIGKLSASASNHFLPPASSLKVVKNPDQPREDGLVERMDCRAQG